ncbi:MAG: hypothetical protein HRT77_07615 [Halioglobus sp.]|nr:hypothetical protein [Halioglobus sp.]
MNQSLANELAVVAALLALERFEGEWQTIPTPTHDGIPFGPIYLAYVNNRRAVIVEQGKTIFRCVFHVADYDTVDGWTYRGGASAYAALGGLTSIANIFVDANIVVANTSFAGNYHMGFYRITTAGFQLIIEQPGFSPSQGDMALSDGIAFDSRSFAYNTEGVVQVYDPANNCVPVEASLSSR